jgi:outer membrane receptor protein involved in Fe transport
MGIKDMSPITGFSSFRLIMITTVICLLPTTIFAQDEEEEFLDDELFLEEVVVTGTRIKRRDFTSPSPLTTISDEEIAFSGQPTLEGYLNQMPQVQPGFDRTSNNPGNGTAQIDLRGLGPGRTLVMMNGRRFAPSGTGSAVDANNLPGSLVDRVEIITGGASTVYGSDAIAGVVNFITKEDFDGLSMEADYNISGEGDAEIWDFNVTYGLNFESGRGNITFFAGQYEREELFSSEREISRNAWVTTWTDTNIYPGGSSRTPAGVVFGPPYDFGNGPQQVTWNPDGTPRAFKRPDDLWNFAPVNYLQLPMERMTAGIIGRYEVSDRVEAYYEALYVENEIKANLAPAPPAEFLFTNVDNPLWSPQTRTILESWQVAPGVAGMFFARRMLELGNRIFDRDNTFQRYVGGLRGELTDGWEFDAWIIWSKSDETTDTLNNGSTSRLQQALFVDPATGQCFDPSGGCAPADVFGEGRLSQAAVDFIKWGALTDIATREQKSATIVVTGSPFDIWTGQVDAAFGFEWREDTASFEADPILFTGDVMGIGGSLPVFGTEKVYEVFGEAVMTLFESSTSDQKIDFEVGARWSDYKNAGSVTTWKAGLDWRLSESWRFRAMAQHAVRAPNNGELFTAQTSDLGSAFGNFGVDPCSASQNPAAAGNSDKCILQGLSPDQIGIFEHTQFYPVEFFFGGNPELTPEASDTITAGFVFSPISIPDLTIAIDYYDMEVTDTIGGIDAMAICFDPLNTEGVFCELTKRDASGNVAEITEYLQNKGLLRSEGIDFQLRYSRDLPDSWAIMGDYAEVSINTAWTHVLASESQQDIVTEIVDCKGYFGWPCALSSEPEDRVTTNFNYRSGPFTAHLTWRWINGMKNANPLGSSIFGIPPESLVLAIPEIPAWSYLDLGLGYDFNESTSIKFGINNIEDKDPAFMADAGFGTNTAPAMYDVFGRSYYLNVTHRFGGDE